MQILSKKEPILWFIGDILIFAFGLWLALLFRYGEIPDRVIIGEHLIPFSVLFAIWLIVFFIAGLYDTRTTRLKNELRDLLVSTQLVNGIIGIVFFYFIPYFGIAPKTILFIQILLSLGLIIPWRMYGEQLFGLRKRERAILIGSKKEVSELFDQVNNNTYDYFQFVALVDIEHTPENKLKEEFLHAYQASHATIIVCDVGSEKMLPILPELYALMFANVQFISVQKLYEEVLGRIPLTLLGHSWILENISLRSRFIYDALKRTMDVMISLVLIICTLPLLPLVALFVKLDDGGPVFIAQERVGEKMRIMRLFKVRSMSASDRGKWVTEDDDRITRAGKFLRKSRIDELPQLWSVLRGNLSLIGPRPDICDLGKQLAGMISYYNLRSTIKPGLSGWAQVNQEKPPQSVEETRLRLEYDLYYIKHRSFILDLKIALRTLKTLMMRAGI